LVKTNVLAETVDEVNETVVLEMNSIHYDGCLLLEAAHCALRLGFHKRRVERLVARRIDFVGLSFLGDSIELALTSR
jgi:hypothetical protein